MISIIFLSFEVIEMKREITYMLLGVGVGLGALASYQQYRNGNMKKAYNKLANKAPKSHENMM